jgi:hypothetical protein
VIRHPKICAMFVSLPCIILCFVGATCLVLYGTESALLASIVVMPFSHNLVASLCCCSVNRFISTEAMLKYYYKPVLNTIVQKISMVGTCKP